VVGLSLDEVWAEITRDEGGGAAGGPSVVDAARAS
jgi:hypothetical protein